MIMTVYITDICAALCPAEADIGRADAARTARVKSAVFDKLGVDAPHPARSSLSRAGRITRRTALIAAVLAALLGATAYAVASFTLNRRDVAPGESVTGYWTYVDENGAITESQKLTYPNAGMVFTFSGPESAYNKPEFRCFYLPCDPTEGFTDENGWTTHLTGTQPTGHSFPYYITASNVPTAKHQYVINGRAEPVEETDWGVWHVLKITSDYSECSDMFRYDNDRVNYILLFDAERGYFVKICGTSDLETLEQIAREMEIRESAEPYTPNTAMSESISILEPGRG